MPINHSGNYANGIVMDGIRSSLVTTLNGRTSGQPIYEVRVSSLVGQGTGGPNLVRLIQSMEKDNLRDLGKRGQGGQYSDLTRQPTDHDDRDGNLPVAPPKLGYREYNIPNNNFTWPGFPRLVADITNKRLYITPTHYDTWFDNQAQAWAQNVNNPGGNRNPFFLLRGVFAYNSLFD